MRRPRATLPLLVLLPALVLPACSRESADTSAPTGTSSPPAATTPAPPSEPESESPTPPTVADVSVERVLARNLEAPWGMTFLPDGSALVAERDTERVLLVSPDGGATPVGRVRGVDGSGEGGLLGLALSPTYGEDSSLFAYFTAGSENVVARLTFDGSRLSDQRTVLDGIPGGPIHNGGRIAFGPDGLLYVGTGEAGRTDLSQDLDSLGGKILRITPDGEPAPGNPFDGSPVYSLGHRNVQGLAWDADGRLWAAEFGQNTWDELNLIEAGANYGWPEVEGRADTKDFHDPVRQWSTDTASPSGIAVAGGSVFMAGLRGERLWQVPLRGQRTAKPRPLFTGRYGRLRTVTAAPDGSLWLSTSNRDGRGAAREGDDRILRLTVD